MGGSGGHWPIVLIEVVLVFGGALAFGWWQLRSIERDRRESARRRQAEAGVQTGVRADAEAPDERDGRPAEPPPASSPSGDGRH